MGYGNERMPWHPSRPANAASLQRHEAGYGRLSMLVVLFTLTVAAETGRSLGRWLKRFRKAGINR